MTKATRFNLDSLLRSEGRKDIETIVTRILEHPGESYVLQYQRLLAQSKKLKCSGVHLLNYIVLASFRDYYSYKTNGDNTLNATLSPLSKQSIIDNPFLNRYGNKIYFLLEPNPTGHIKQVG